MAQRTQRNRGECTKACPILKRLDDFENTVTTKLGRVEIAVAGIAATATEQYSFTAKTLTDHENRLRERERSAWKIAGQASVIAAIVGIVVPILVTWVKSL